MTNFLYQFILHPSQEYVYTQIYNRFYIAFTKTTN